MRFVAVDELPEKTNQKYRTNNLIGYLEEFMKMNTKIVRVDFDLGEYSRIESARQAIYQSIRTHGFPIKLCLRNRVIYLVRKDI